MTKAIFLLLAAFSIYNFFLLDKLPIVTPDEVWFANYAYSLTSKEKLSSIPFENRLPKIDENSKIAYGPVYPLILSIPLRVLPYGLTTTRATSIFFGALAILVVFLLTKSLFKNNTLALLSAILLSIDPSFLLRARFVRPEILIILFTYLSYLFYFRKKYLLTGVFISLSIFSHYFIGLIPGVVIIFHYFLNKDSLKSKNVILLILPTIILLIFWLFYISTQNVDTNGIWQTVLAKRVTPNFQLLTSFPKWDTQIAITFSMYLLSFLLILISKINTDTAIKRFCILNFLIAFTIFAFGNAVVYDGICTIPAILCLLAISRIKYILPLFLSALIFSNISYLLLTLNIAYPSYNSFGKVFSKDIEQNSKVLLKQTNPDPYFYLAEKRPDLKLDYFQVVNKQNYQKSLSEADYIITHGYDLKFFEDYKKNHLPQNFPFDLTLTEFLEANESKTQVVTNINTPYIYNIVVIKISNPANSKD